MSIRLVAASTTSTTTKPVGTSITASQIARTEQVTNPNNASQSRNVKALEAGAAPPIPAVGSW